MFLLNMERSYPLSYLQTISIPRKMEWHLIEPQDWVLLGGLGSTMVFSTTIGKHITGVLPGLLKKDYPVGETLKTASTFFKLLHHNAR